MREGWICKTCGRSYGPGAMECNPCNWRITERENLKPPALPEGVRIDYSPHREQSTGGSHADT